MARIIAAIAAAAPFLMLVPTAYLVAWRTMQHLAWPLWVAVAAAVGLEALGVVIAVTGLDAWTWNRSKRKSDPTAPVALPVVLLAVYFVSAEALTFGLDIAAGPVTFAKLTQAVFPVLGLAGMVTLAARYDQTQRVAEVKATKAEAKAERVERRQAKVKPLPVALEQEPAAQEPQIIGYVCDKCGRTIVGQKEYAGHRRWCAGGDGHERIAVVQEAQG